MISACAGNCWARTGNVQVPEAGVRFAQVLLINAPSDLASESIRDEQNLFAYVLPGC